MNAGGKVELRKRLKAERARLSAEQAALSSEQVSRHILACDAYRKAHCIMGYLAFGKELSVDAVLLAALAEGKTVVVPLVTSATEMTPVVLQNMHDFELDRYGIRSVRQPAEQIAPQDIDLVLVPGVAFDREGGRLGMGAGYYDRFLPQAENALLMGIAYDAFIQPNLPRDEFDVLVQLLASESGITTLSPLSL